MLENPVQLGPGQPLRSPSQLLCLVQMPRSPQIIAVKAFQPPYFHSSFSTQNVFYASKSWRAGSQMAPVSSASWCSHPYMWVEPSDLLLKKRNSESDGLSLLRLSYKRTVASISVPLALSHISHAGGSRHQVLKQPVGRPVSRWTAACQ